MTFHQQQQSSSTTTLNVMSINAITCPISNYQDNFNEFDYKRSRNASESSCTLSCSSSANESDFNSSCSPSSPRTPPPQTHWLSFDNTDYDKKGNALKTRRARNKLASAKYRAKKQAQTHIMQNRIIQLATQVMTLRDELDKSKKNETETLGKYERLVHYLQLHDNTKNSSINNNGIFDRRTASSSNTALTSLF